MGRFLWTVLGLALLAGTVTMTQGGAPRGQVAFKDGVRVSVEIADTDRLRQRGLMFRERLAPDEGMIFVFPASGDYPFWMKNTLIPLDMIWVDAGRRVVAIAHDVPPCEKDPCPTYPPNATALYVVEVAAGFASAHGVAVGDVLTLTGIGPARDAR